MKKSLDSQVAYEREVFSGLALSLLEAVNSYSIGRAAARACEQLFQPHAFLFTERQPDSDFFLRILAFDVVNGQKAYIDSTGATPQQYTSLADLHTGKPIRIDLSEHGMKELGNFGSGKRSLSLLFAPVMLDATLYAVLSVQSYTPHRYSQADLELLQSIAKFISPAFKRLQAEKEVLRSRERFRRAIEQMDAVPYERDAKSGLLTYAGEGIKQLTGYTVDELKPDVWKQLIVEAVALGGAQGKPFKEACAEFESGALRNWKADYRIRTKDGRLRWIRDNGVGQYGENGEWTGTLGTLQDVTEEKRNQLLREELAELGVRLSAVNTTRGAAEVVAKAADRLMTWDFCIIAFYAKTENTAYILLMIDTIDGVRQEFIDPRQEEPGQIYQKALKEGALLLSAEDVLRIKSTKLGSNNPSQSLMFAPIREKGESIGIISLQSYTPNAFTRDDLAVLQLLADYCASAIERTRALEKLRDRDERYRAAIAFANAIPYERDYIHDELNYMGEGIQNLTGYAPEEMTVPLWTSLVQEIVLHGEAKTLTLDQARDKARSGEITNWCADYRLRTKDGRTKWVTDSSVSIRNDEGVVAGTLGILLDITARVQSERLNKALSRLGHQLSGAQSSHEVATVLANVADELIGWDAAFITIYTPEDDTAYNILNIDTWDGAKHHVPSLFDKPRQPTLTMRRIFENGALLTTKDEAHSRMVEGLFLPYGNTDTYSEVMMYVPIRKSNDRVIGIFSIQSYTPGVYSQESLQLLQSLADHGSGALERTFFQESLKRSEEKSELLADLAHRLNAVRTAHAAGEIIAGVAKKLFGWDAFVIDLYSADEDKLHDVLNIDTVDGKEVQFSSRRLGGRVTSFMRRVLNEGAFMILRTPEELNCTITDQGIVAFGQERRSASLMFAPARMGDRVVGMISIQSYKLNAYQSGDLQTLQVLADHCGGALERITVEGELMESEQRYKLAARGANDGLWDWDLVRDQIYYSPRLKDMLGYNEELSNLPTEWFSRVHPQDMEILKQALDEHIAGSTTHFQNEHRILHKDGAYCWVLCRGLAVRNGSQAVRIAGSMTDITERRAAEEQLAHAAFYDPLTGLANRSLFMDRLEHCLTRSKRREGYVFGVLFIDIDRFKMVNDSLGHLVGDKLLQEIGKRLALSLREGDTIARIGGDEFTVILEDNSEVNQAMRVADRLIEQFEEPFQIEEFEIYSNASIGIAMSTTGYSKVEEILRDADTALYRAKETGRGRYVMFDHRMHESVTAFIRTENGLRLALKNNELRLHYQPIMNLRNGQISGFEALVRWERPGEGLVPPGQFIPVAEDTGMIVQIGEWVLREACRQLAEWTKCFPQAENLFMSVNLSPRQFASPSIGDFVEDLIRSESLDPRLIHVEITETAILKEPQNVRAIVERWKAMGIRIMLDDFGTGFSPLAHLVSFPVDCIKIDRAFVGRMEENIECQHIVRAIVSLARIFHLDVIAEGAETRSQIEALRALNCDFAQGYFISRPLAASEIERLYFVTAAAESQ